MDWNLIHPLSALTHFDGRNGQKLGSLKKYFSEHAWMKYRLYVMARYLEFLSTQKLIPGRYILDRNMFSKFTLSESEKISRIEKETNHDLRSLEIYFKNLLKSIHRDDISPYVNLGIGSEDINNIALRLQFREALYLEILPAMGRVLGDLLKLSENYQHQILLGRTHGQPAALTTFGKEISIFAIRLSGELDTLLRLKLHGKVSGEVGTFAALASVFSGRDWLKLEERFLGYFELSASPATQIVPYDDVIHFFDVLKNCNAILTNFAKDIWLYASFGYLSFANISAETGSAGMPHKINPQYFEGAEGGLEYANAQWEFFSRKLSQTRLQRDFSDSTVRRNIVIPVAYSLLSCQSLEIGIRRMLVNTEKMEEDAGSHWESASEILLAFLKSGGNDQAYEAIKLRMRGKTFTFSQWQNFISDMHLDESLQKYLLGLTPGRLVGESSLITAAVLKKARQMGKSIDLVYKKYFGSAISNI